MDLQTEAARPSPGLPRRVFAYELEVLLIFDVLMEEGHLLATVSQRDDGRGTGRP